MPIRDRLALTLVSITVMALPLFGTLAHVERTGRKVDVPVLWLAGFLQLGLVLTWALLPRLPRWIVAGWGLILIAAGFGFTIAAPVSGEPGAGTFPWGFAGLVLVGIVTALASIIHSGSEGPVAVA